MAFTTAQDFIDVWEELDAAYVTFPAIVGAGGDYTGTTPLDTSGQFLDALSQFPQYAFVLENADVDSGALAYAVNLLFVQLAEAYIDWLEAGNPPILDYVAKDRGGPPAPGQSLHDNILGNLNDGPINDRFVTANGNPDITGDGDGDVVAEPRSLDGQAWGARPVFSGANTSNLAETIAFDLANGVPLGQLDITGDRATALEGEILVVSASGVTSYPDAASAAAAAGAGDTIVAGGDGADDTFDFSGSAANKFVFGAGGDDSVVFAGDREDFAIVQNADGSFTVTDTHAGDGDEGVTTLVGVESVSFGNYGFNFELDADSPDYAKAEVKFEQGFETDSEGWLTSIGSSNYGAISVVASGADGITSADGAGHAVFTQVDDTGPFTRFDGYRNDFGEGFKATMKIYLDLNWIDGEGFSYSVAANGQDGAHQRDFIFHVTKDADTGTIVIGASNNSSFDPQNNLETKNHASVDQSGWYTFEQEFYENEDGDLEVALNVYDAAGNWVFTEVRSDPNDDIDSVVGGNRYGWFTNIDVAGGIEVDSVSLQAIDSGPIQVTDENGVILGTFDTIQEAIDAATPGSTIEVPAGTYEENVNVNKDVTLLGANAGTSGTDGGRGAETVIVGQLTFNAAGATLDGFRVEHGASTGGSLINLWSDDVTVTNSVLVGDYPDGNTRGIVTSGAADNATISDNLMEDVRSGIYFNVGAGAVVTGNTFQSNGNGINADGPEMADISGNTFNDSVGAQVALGATEAVNDFGGFLGVNTFSPPDNTVTVYPLSSSPDGAVLIGTPNDDNFRGDIVAGWVNQNGQTYDGGAGDDRIFAGAGDDILIGGEGADTLDGGSGVDTADYSGSSAGVDVALLRASQLGGDAQGDTLTAIENLVGSAFADTLQGDGSANVFEGGAGDDVLAGGAGDDVLDGGADNDQVFGGDGDDTLTGGDGDDVVNGQLGNDVVRGGAGDDVLQGASGDDLLIGGEGADILRGGPGNDTASYEGSASGVDVALWLAGAQSGGDAAGDILRDIENLSGSDHNDNLEGTNGANILSGGDGDDRLQGWGGDDTLDGGAGQDIAVIDNSGGAAFDPAVFDFSGLSVDPSGVISGTVIGPDGVDTLSGIELLEVENTGSSTWVVLDGMSIQDAIDAASDGDTIYVMPGTYTEDLTISKGVEILGANAGLAGDDAGRGAESIIDGLVTIDAASAVTIDGVQFLNDEPTGSRGQLNQLTVATAADHVITNSAFISTVAGGGTGGIHDVAIFTNVLASGALEISNNFFGGDGSFADSDQYSTAAWGRGVWSNGGGAEVLITGNTFENTRTGVNLDNYDNATSFVSNNNFVDSGTGIAVGVPTSGLLSSIRDNTFQDVDTDFNARNLTGDVTVNLGAVFGNAAIAGDALDSGGVEIDDPNGTLVYLSGNGGDTVVGTGGNDIIVGDHTGAGDDVIAGRDGDDIIFGNGGADVLYGDDGNDTLDGGAGDDRLLGGNGDDTFIGGAGSDEMRGGLGIDTVDYADSAAGVNVRLWAKFAQLGGDAAGDTLFGIENVIGSDHNDDLQGTHGVNVMRGGAGDDRLRAWDGDDILEGGEGNDILEGGNGADTFVFAPSANGTGVDQIWDFEDGIDLIDLSAYGLSGFSDLTITTTGSVTRISGFGDGDDEILVSSLVTVDESDFIFS